MDLDSSDVRAIDVLAGATVGAVGLSGLLGALRARAEAGDQDAIRLLADLLLFVRRGRLEEEIKLLQDERPFSLAALAAAAPAELRDVAAELGGEPLNLQRAIALHARFVQTGRQADLDEAIGLLSQAVPTLPAGHPARPLSLTTLGTALQSRFRLNGRPEDLDQAIAVLGEAAATGEPVAMYSLGMLLEERGDAASAAEAEIWFGRAAEHGIHGP